MTTPPPFCPFCPAVSTPDAPTLSQHLKTCEAYAVATLTEYARPKPKRAASVRPDTEKPVKPCARCGLVARVPGKSYCQPCGAEVAAEQNSIRYGNKPATRRRR